MSRQSCAVCAWREHCNKRFSVNDAGAHCLDFSRDVSIKDMIDLTEKATHTKESHTK
ncbi:MAG: hypothetical protein HXX11_19155 [Desulfuromonadales bacterium]|nr:hypothetical protein [Desulfuromonadales bacterium]